MGKKDYELSVDQTVDQYGHLMACAGVGVGASSVLAGAGIGMATAGPVGALVGANVGLVLGAPAGVALDDHVRGSSENARKKLKDLAPQMATESNEVAIDARKFASNQLRRVIT